MPDALGPTNGVFIDKPTAPPDVRNPEPGLRIRHHVPTDHENSVKRDCIWCGRPTDILAETPFRPDLGYLPLMVTCGAHMRIVYRAVQNGQPLDAWEEAAVRRIAGIPNPELLKGPRLRVLLLTAHDVAEYDDLRMLTDMGHDVFSIGAYTNPHETSSGIRPPLDVPRHPEFERRCIEQREKHAGEPEQAWIAGQLHNLVDWAKADLHQDIIDWADVVICHHYLESWVVRQWSRFKDKRVIWRTCGQSNAYLEETMAELHKDGLEIVRYSPKEEVAFTRLGTWAGQDALIRFGKYPADWYGWTGEDAVVGNVTQNMAGRGEFCGVQFWAEATRGLPVKPAGLQSEALPGGIGALTYDEMREYLRRIRVYLYTGTQPASYTLALIEAMMTGVPVVSMPSDDWWVPDLFEGDELALSSIFGAKGAHDMLNLMLEDHDWAKSMSAMYRTKAIDLFGIETIAPQWEAFLAKVPVHA